MYIYIYVSSIQKYTYQSSQTIPKKNLCIVCENIGIFTDRDRHLESRSWESEQNSVVVAPHSQRGSGACFPLRRVTVAGSIDPRRLQLTFRTFHRDPLSIPSVCICLVLNQCSKQHTMKDGCIKCMNLFAHLRVRLSTIRIRGPCQWICELCHRNQVLCQRILAFHY